VRKVGAELGLRQIAGETEFVHPTRLRELGHPPTLDHALAYLDLLAEQKPEKLGRAAVRWHGRLETEAKFLSLAESQLALVALARTGFNP
jgi:hypothetical protein